MKKNTVLLLGLFAVALVAYIFLDLRNQPDSSALADQTKKILVFDSEKIMRLELKNAKGYFVFQKHEKDWALEEPIKTPAVQALVQAVLDELNFENKRSLIRSSVDADFEVSLEKYGLTVPQVKLYLKDREGLSYALLLGKPTPLAGSLYALVDDGRKKEIIVVGVSLEELLNKSLYDWRDKKVFGFEVHEVTHILIHHDEQDLDIKRTGQKWQLIKPLTRDINAKVIADLLETIYLLQTQEFVSEDSSNLVSYGLAQPVYTVEITTANGQKEKVSLGVATPQRPEFIYATHAARPVIFTLERGILDVLKKTWTTLLENQRS